MTNNLSQIRVPDIGDFKDVPIVEIPIAVGDMIAADDTIVVVESDKATLDVPTSQAGTVIAIRVAPGDLVSEGTVVLELDIEGEAAANSPSEDIPAPQPAPAEPAAEVAAQTEKADPRADMLPVAVQPGVPVHASPSVRRYARILGVAVADVHGSGRKGRMTRGDIEAHVKTRLTASPKDAPAGIAGLPEWPQIDFAKFGPIQRQPLSRIVRISGPSLARNSIMIPHVTNFDKADVTDLDDFRKQLNAEAGPAEAKMTLLAFTVKAVVAALKTFPRFNSSLEGEELVLKNYWNIGVAADTSEGLVVPVVKEVDHKGIREIAAEMANLAAQARAGKLKPTDMQGATFTISSLGGIGGTNFTPIINAPEVAILGMTRAEIQPVWDGAAFQPRLIQPISLSWDHRVIDGVAAARFLVHVTRTLGDFRRIAI